jgi:haloalkane dehalogenase
MPRKTQRRRGVSAHPSKIDTGARGQPHTIVENAGHFLQEDQGEALAQVVLRLCERTLDK